MGKMFESLRRSSERPPVRLASGATLKVAPAEDDLSAVTLMPLPLPLPAAAAWPALAEGQTIPYIEVPELIARAARSGTTPAVVPFPAPAADRSGESALWRPVPAPVSDESWTKVAEALLHELRLRDARSLLLLPLEDASRMADLTADLSAALSGQLQQPILLIDTLRGSESAAGKLRLAAAPGWEELLLGLDWAQAVQRSGILGLDAIVAGNRLAQATPARWAKDSGQRLRGLADRYRLLLVTSQPWPRSPLGMLLAAETETACLAVPAAAVDGPAHHQLLQQLQAEGRAVLGSLVMS